MGRCIDLVSINAQERKMNLFRLHAENEQGETRSLRMWTVIAGNLYEAVSLIPEDFSVNAVTVQSSVLAGPGRAIGSISESIVH